MAALVHLMRHGEVDNPDQVVYAALSGYGLSDRGRRQARAAARYLGSRPVVAVWSSPLERALETAAGVADRLGLPVQVDDDLVEWRLADVWAGVRWEDLPTERPGQLEAYLEQPTDLEWSPESLTGLARRMVDAVERIHRRHEGDVVVVSHQDPVQAARLALTGGELADLHRAKPGHAEVITLRPGAPWREEARWSPEEDSAPPAEPRQELGIGGEGQLGQGVQ